LFSLFLHRIQTSLDPSLLQRQSTSENRTFFDIKRQWAATCPPNQLDFLVNAAKAATETVETAVAQTRDLPTNSATNLVASARENFINAVNKPKSGRTLLDVHSIPTVDENDLELDEHYYNSQVKFISPVLLTNTMPDNNGSFNRSKPGNNPLSCTFHSARKQLASEAASSFRRYYEIRQKFTNDRIQYHSTKRSLEYNKSLLKALIHQRDLLLAQQANQALGRLVPSELTQVSENYINAEDKSPENILAALDEVDCKEQNCKRVIAQLERQIPALDATLKSDTAELSESRSMLFDRYKESQRVSQNYSDPIPSSFGKDKFMNNRLLSNLQSRQLGCIDRCLGRTVVRSMGRSRQLGAHIENNRSLLYNRFSHAATINTHLHYPVYCLRFDQTGRYFVTGADDSLVRVFCLGESIVPKKHGLVDRSTYCRGAVLVCTLKGHAGVVNDICVSTDNAFLATASEDGDCRVWGLKDGCPVAILRGHKGGANMV
jgi:WD40 repeat protein